MFAAAGFIGGVQVQKRQGGTPVATTGAAGGPGGPAGAAGGGARGRRGRRSGRGGRRQGTTVTSAAGEPARGPPPPRPRPVPAVVRPAGRRPGRGQGRAAARRGRWPPARRPRARSSSVDGPNIYVTDAQGNVVKVVTSPSSRFTKTGPATVQDVRPGDTVIVQGQKGEDGIVTATAVTTSGAATP